MSTEAGIETPPGDHQTGDHQGYQQDVPTTPVELDELSALLDRLRWIDEQVKKLAAEADELKAAIQDVLGDREVGAVGGRTAVTWFHHLRHTFDQKRFHAENPDVWERYLRVTPYRAFRVEDPRPGFDQ